MHVQQLVKMNNFIAHYEVVTMMIKTATESRCDEQCQYNKRKQVYNINSVELNPI